MKLSVIIPVYNEESTVCQVIEQVKAVSLPYQMTREILVINDGSTDKTQEILKVYEDDPLVNVINKPNNEGKTSAIIKGFEQATGDLLIVQDADLEYLPEDFPALLKPILDGKADVVYGSRFLGYRHGVQFINAIANGWSNITFFILYWKIITDINTCYKLFKREALDGVVIESTHFTFETEITAKMLNRGFHIVEVPIKYLARDRKHGKKITMGTALSMYWGMFKYRFSK